MPNNHGSAKNGSGMLSAFVMVFATIAGVAGFTNYQLVDIKDRITKLEMGVAAHDDRVLADTKERIAAAEQQLSLRIDSNRDLINAHVVLTGHPGVMSALAAITEKFVEVETQFRLGKVAADQDREHLRDRIIKTESITEERGPRLAVLEEKVRRLEDGHEPRSIKP